MNNYWLKNNSFKAAQFKTDWLQQQKEKQKLTVSVGIPTLNVEQTLGEVLKSCCQLKEETGLVDQIAIIDSYSTDSTLEVAKKYPVEIYNDAEILSQVAPAKGKGEALWKSLAVLKGDIIVWLDSDVYNFSPYFITGLIGPLLAQPHLVFVKAFYRRPLVNRQNKQRQSLEGGRVTEILMRPFLNLFWPELSYIIQPLAGESAGRKKVLQSIPFFTDYAVEAGLLINIYRQFGLERIAQVNLGERIHSHQSLSALGRMSFAILQALMRLLEKEERFVSKGKLNDVMHQFVLTINSYQVEATKVTVTERPPIIELLSQTKNFSTDSFNSDYFLV